MTVLASSLALALTLARPDAIAEAPVAVAGAQAAPLLPADAVSVWRGSLATGVAGKFGGQQISSRRDNPNVLLYFGGQADADWSAGRGQAARLRFRLLTGGEKDIYVPSDGDVEAAYMLGRREFRFVLLRAEVARHPALAIQALAQAGTLPCFDGTISLAGDSMRLSYFISPIEAAWVRYTGPAHITHVPGWTTESDKPSAASAGRVRYALLLPPAFVASVEAEAVKFWGKDDLLVAAEGGLGYTLRDQGTAFNALVRWTSYTRRGLVKDTSESEDEVLLLLAASLYF
jgi:hypothetical protein